MTQSCKTCNIELADGIKFCPQCGAKSPERLAEESFGNQTRHYVGEAAEELWGAAKETYKHGRHLADKDSAKKVAGGAAIGALAGLPVVGWAAGAAIGAGVVAYRHINKKNGDKGGEGGDN